MGTARAERASAFTFEDAVAEMARADLGHKRRTDRLADSVRRISEHPGGSLPEKFQDPAAYRGTLRLMNHPRCTHHAVLDPHVQATRDRIAACDDTVLILHDTTELDYSNQLTLDAMGPIGNGGGKGYECHNSLAVSARTGENLGLTCQILHSRVRKPQGERVKASRERASRESRLWVSAVAAIGPPPPGRHVVDVCDRGADTFEFLEYEATHQRHFVIRSTHSRALVVHSGDGPHLLHDLLRSLPAEVGWTVDISANKGQPARTAKLLCSWAEVSLRAPAGGGGIQPFTHAQEPLSTPSIGNL